MGVKVHSSGRIFGPNVCRSDGGNYGGSLLSGFGNGMNSVGGGRQNCH